MLLYQIYNFYFHYHSECQNRVGGLSGDVRSDRSFCRGSAAGSDVVEFSEKRQDLHVTQARGLRPTDYPQNLRRDLSWELAKGAGCRSKTCRALAFRALDNTTVSHPVEPIPNGIAKGHVWGMSTSPAAKAERPLCDSKAVLCWRLSRAPRLLGQALS